MQSRAGKVTALGQVGTVMVRCLLFLEGYPSRSPGPSTASLPLGKSEFWGSHPEARLELLQGWSWGAASQYGRRIYWV